MTRIVHILLILSAMLIMPSCHDTIHSHPWEEDTPIEDVKAMLTLHIDNKSPQLGAIIDYTISPAVIIYSDDLPDKVTAHVREASRDAADNAAGTYGSLVQRAVTLADALDEIAPYAPDGDKWELHMKYEVYAGTTEQVKDGRAETIKSGKVTYRADVTGPEHDVELEMPAGSIITVVAVAYIVPAGTDGDWFFDTRSLGNLICDMDKRQGEHDNIYRDCFVVSEEFSILPSVPDGEIQHLTATLTRPQGRYMVIADDYETYLGFAGTDISHTVAHIHYPSYINVAYSALLHMPTESSFGFGYDYHPSLTYADAAPYVRLGDDWSFVNGDRSNFMIDITVRDKDSETVISQNSDILVPVFPGRVTLVVGHWLTKKADSGGGGVVIDPNFSDEIILHF